MITNLIRSPLPAPRHIVVNSERFTRCSEDFLHVAEELCAHIQHIKDLKTVIVEQIDLLDKRRNRLIGLLIAVYVPLAFGTVCVD